MAEWYRQGKAPDSSTRATWESHQQSFSINAGGTSKRNDEFGLTNYLCSYFEGILHAIKSTWGRRLYFPSEERRPADLYRP
jgi:hypothetical protein